MAHPVAARVSPIVRNGPVPAGGGAWDVVVVGAGLGGATLGHALAAAGRSVLFVEKGHAAIGMSAAGAEMLEDPVARVDSGWWPDRMAARIDGRDTTPFPALGCGAGGSSLLFAAALERFDRSDVETMPGDAHPTGGWPIAWAAMAQGYAEAERLYRVVGTADPLSPDTPALPRPPPASAVDDALAASFTAAGLHPYRLHVGMAYRAGCGECGGRVCALGCKSDARRICIDPALTHHGARLVADAEVEAIEADATHATGVVYACDGVAYRVRGRMIVLAAGAYRTPAILLRSRSAAWPDGLANRTDQVGRYLMFHANEWFAVWPRRQASTQGPRKTIGMRDLYRHGGMRLGGIQSTGLEADAGNIHFFLRGWFDASRWRRWRVLRPGLKIAAIVAQRLFGTAAIFVMLVEDLGYADNRVLRDAADPAQIAITYTVRDELRRRARAARRLVRRRLRGLRVLPLQGDVQLNFGHPCGTCRAGVDPATSVVDGDCRAHGIDNLYVADASFMPSSGGTNPGLTVIANALRVAAIIGARLQPAAAPPRALTPVSAGPAGAAAHGDGRVAARAASSPAPDAGT